LIVIIPDNPADFTAPVDIGFGGNFTLQDVGNGEMGYVIGAQNLNGRLIAEPFNAADTTATNQLFSGNAPFGWGDFSANETQCALPPDQTGSVNDTAVINNLLTNITNYNTNEANLNIPYPSPMQTVTGSGAGYVNSNSWALSALEFNANVPVSDLNAHNTDSDDDGTLDTQDNDDDNDGVPDAQDGHPRDNSQS